MWSEKEKNLPMFETAVQNITHPDGHPCSLRCRSKRDLSSGLLWLYLAAGEAVQAGLVSLLYHSHDEKLGNQKTFLRRGRTEEAGGSLPP
jgi:hypothetical protein